MTLPGIDIADGFTDGKTYCFAWYGEYNNCVWKVGGVDEANTMFRDALLDTSKMGARPVGSLVYPMFPYVYVGKRYWSKMWGRWVIKPDTEVNAMTYIDGYTDGVSEAVEVSAESSPANRLCFGPFPEDNCIGYPAPQEVQGIGNAQYIGVEFFNDHDGANEWEYASGIAPVIMGCQLPAGETFVEDGGRVRKIIMVAYGYNPLLGGIISEGGTTDIVKDTYTHSYWNHQRYTQGGADFSYKGPHDHTTGTFGPPEPPFFGGPAGIYNCYTGGIGDVIGLGTDPGDFTLCVTAQCFYEETDPVTMVVTTTPGDTAFTIYGGTGFVHHPNLVLAIVDTSTPGTYLTVHETLPIPSEEILYDHQIQIRWSGSINVGIVAYEVQVVQERPARTERLYTTYPGGIPGFTESITYLYQTQDRAQQQVTNTYRLTSSVHEITLYAPGGTDFTVYVKEVYEDGTVGAYARQTYHLELYSPPAPTFAYTANRGTVYIGEDNL